MPVDRMHELNRKRAENDAAQTNMVCIADAKPIQDNLDKLRNLNQSLEQHQLRHVTTCDKRSAKKVETTVASISHEANITRNMIVKFGNETKRLESSGQINSSEAAVRRNVFDNFARKLYEVTKGSWDMQEAHDLDVTRQVERRLRTRFTDNDGTVTVGETELQRIAKELVTSGREDQVLLLARDELEKAERTRDAVRELERDMRELYLLFCDMNVLVMEQREGLEEAQASVQHARDQVQQGAEDLRKAKKYQKKCCLVM